MSFPTHILYADDVIVFCKATGRNIKNIAALLGKYASSSGQYCNPSKSRFFLGRGVARAAADRVLQKFSKWEGRMLSIAGRVCLVNSVIANDIYSSSRSAVAWEQVCGLKEEGGLGVTSFAALGKSLAMRLAWKVLTGSAEVYSLFRQRYLNHSCYVVKYKSGSSIWHNVKAEIPELVAGSHMILGMTPFTKAADEHVWRRSVHEEATIKVAKLYSRCHFATKVMDFTSLNERLAYCIKLKFSSQVAVLWRVGVITLGWSIWNIRNQATFEDFKPSVLSLIMAVQMALKESNLISAKMGFMSNTVEDLMFLKSVGMPGRIPRPKLTVSVIWRPPPSRLDQD
ncbi:hypothetical protein C2S52_020892 [Perilla frutescens var. hirtella]|nr:hypothetical protein C2S52_020892 [Perilla frutescens var. hirtella]KAH6805005.1 hypothetical protein C2S51_029836 [Perilla frutescens var. frutescens]